MTSSGGARGNDVIRSGRQKDEIHDVHGRNEEPPAARGFDKVVTNARSEVDEVSHPQVGDDETAAHCLRTFRVLRTRRRSHLGSWKWDA